MPILAAETPVYPDDLLNHEAVPINGRRWWAVYTKARQEKSLARQLVKFQVPFYLPLVAKDLRYRGRRVKSFNPLFSGYVFLYGSEEERVKTLTTNRISRVLPVPDQKQLYDDLKQVHQLIDSDAPLTVEKRLAPGQRVRVRDGALMGLEGTVTSRVRRCRLVVAVNFLQQGVSVEIDDFLLEPLD